MTKSFVLTLFFITLISCKNNLENENKRLIVGDWKFFYEEPVIPKDGNLTVIKLPLSIRNKFRGYEFKENGVYDNKLGFFKEAFNKIKGETESIYLGRSSTYEIKNDSLKLYNKSNEKWESFKIKNLQKDTLELVDTKNESSKWTRVHFDKSKVNLFDKIVVSSSGCYGSCPVQDLLIDNTGKIIFNGRHYADSIGFFTAITKKEEFLNIENDFLKSGWYNLKNDYEASHTDDQTISVTFIKNNKIVKTIEDYGQEAPVEFFWAYREIRHLQRKVKLEKVKNTTLLLDFYYSYFEDKSTILYLAESESFFLKSMLLNAKIVDTKKIEKYKINYWSDESKKTIFSDGRFFTFKAKDGKEITLDLGFNFLKENGFLNKFKAKTKDDF